MKIHLMILLLVGPLSGRTQTVVRSMQTVNNDKELSMTIVGTKDGRSFRHALRYDVTGLAKTQRDSLYGKSVEALATLGITNVPGMQVGTEKTADRATVPSGVITIACETCTRKGQLELYGSNYLHTRNMKPKGEPQNRFPLTMQLGSDRYRLVYKQKGRQPVEIPFMLSGGETKQLAIPYVRINR